MKICFLADLHLPEMENAVQYKVLDWAIADIAKKEPDLVVFAGDYTADGAALAIERFQTKMNSLTIPVVLIPGNSDFRSSETMDTVRGMASGMIYDANGIKLLSLMDGEGTISDEIFHFLETADENTIVCGHHPPDSLRSPYGERLLNWCRLHKNIPYFCGHKHYSGWIDSNIYLLPAADPDKSIGENPAITYYSTETKELRKAYFYCPVPYDLRDYIGISCRNFATDIPYATDHIVRHIELRTRPELKELLPILRRWREAGGKTLSVHAPDIFCADRKNYNVSQWAEHIRFVREIAADRMTVHVPNIPVWEATDEKLKEIALFLAEQFSELDDSCVIGVENMHMTSDEQPDESRRFGYVPTEVYHFVNILRQHTPKIVGTHLDVGHARNNRPFSQKYPIGSWYCTFGTEANGYHIHQVLQTEAGMKNHMPIDRWYGKLISYASFFREWSDGVLKKAPVFLEIRPENGYMETIELLEREVPAFDLHAHTRYSFCGGDEPQAVVNTAVRNGIRMLGITDHNYGIGKRKAEYIREMRQLAKDNKDRIQILCGIEIATLPHVYDIVDTAEIAECDYCLLEHIDSPESIAYGKLFSFVKQLGILCGIAHTDLFAYCEQMGFAYETFFDQLAKAGIFWEMNVSYDSIHHYREHAYVIDFMNDVHKQKIIRDAGVYVSVGFDGHRCEDYDGFKVSEMVNFLHRAGIRTADELFY